MEIDFGVAAGVTAIMGLVIYSVACIRHRVVPPLIKIVEALGFGGLIAVGIRMAYAAFHAKELCSIVDKDGKVVENAELQLKFGEHTWEVLVGGVCIVVASAYSLGWLCRKPSHD